MESSDTFTCARCNALTDTHDGSLGLAFIGAGDRGVIDTFPDPAIEVTLCEGCALHMLKQESWMLEVCKPSLNINYGHACLDGSIDWTPISECETDPDRHGWVRAFVVLPKVEGRPGERAPIRTPTGALATYGRCDSAEDAEALAQSLNAAGFPSRASEMPLGNYRNFYAIVDPAEWSEWWPGYNVKWLRKHRINQLRQTALAVVQNPRWTVTHPLRSLVALTGAARALLSR